MIILNSPAVKQGFLPGFNVGPIEPTVCFASSWSSMYGINVLTVSPRPDVHKQTVGHMKRVNLNTHGQWRTVTL